MPIELPAQLNAAIHQAIQAARQCLAVGDAARAAEACRQVLRHDPGQADALLLLGEALVQQQDGLGALAALRDGLAARPEDTAGWVQLGIACRLVGNLDGAAAAFQHALRLDPGNAPAMNGLGVLEQDRDALDAAIGWFGRAVAAVPDYAIAHKNLAFALGLAGRLEAAESHFQQAMALAPQSGETRLDYALFRLSCADFAQGWQLYESRWRSGVYAETDWGGGKPLWQGEALQGRHLLLWGEQGIGDQILYGTMLHEAIAEAQRQGAGQISIAVTDRLVPLYRRAFAGLPVSVVDRQGAVADADLQIPFASLGGLLRKAVADFTGHDGAYLQADAALRDSLRQRYQVWAGTSRRRLFGLSWRSANPRLATSKSIALSQLRPLLTLPDIAWVSVQYGDASAEIAASGAPLFVDPAIDALRDMDGFAAQLAALDGIVSVSNSGVHLAGALGLPCHLLLAQGRGRLWYWPRPNEPDAMRSRWYAALRLWHQRQPGDWDDTIAALARRLNHG